MNTIDDSHDIRPGLLLGIIDHRLRERMREQLRDLGLRRGTWEVLHRLADGPVSVEELHAGIPGGWRHGDATARAEHDGHEEPEHDHGEHDHEHHEHHEHHEQDQHGPGERHGCAQEGPEHHGHAHHGHAWHHGPGRVGTPEEREAFFEKRRAAFEERFGIPEEREAFFEKRHPEFAERFPTPEEREAFRAGMHARLGFGRPWRGRGERWRGGPRAGRVDRILSDLSEKGWVTVVDGVATLTDAGREVHDAASARIEEVRASLTADVSDADYATTVATLERMARNLGWSRPDAS